MFQLSIISLLHLQLFHLPLWFPKSLPQSPGPEIGCASVPTCADFAWNPQSVRGALGRDAISSPGELLLLSCSSPVASTLLRSLRVVGPGPASQRPHLATPPQSRGTSEAPCRGLPCRLDTARPPPPLQPPRQSASSPNHRFAPPPPPPPLRRCPSSPCRTSASPRPGTPRPPRRPATPPHDWCAAAGPPGSPAPPTPPATHSSSWRTSTGWRGAGIAPGEKITTCG